MWSFIQYKKIGQEVECRWAKQERRMRRKRSNTGFLSVRDSGDLEATRDERACRENIDKTEDNEHAPGNKRSEKDERIPMECNLDNDHDSLNPQNWSLLTRARTIAILCFLVFVQAWAGASDSMVNSKASEYHYVSATAENLTTAMYLFGIGIGCLFVGPLSESFGRNPVYLVFSFAYLLFVLGTAQSKTFASHVVCRFFIGLSSIGTLAINGASVRDMFRPVELTLWYPVMAWMNVVPPVIAPMVGGWVASRGDLDWKWTERITLIVSVFAFLLAVLFLPETYLPILLDWRAKHLRRVAGNDHYVSKHEENFSFVGRLKTILPLSVKFTTTEPAILVLGSYLVLLYILLFTFLSGFDYIFRRTYSLSSLEEGACFASIAIGATAFTLTAPGLYLWTRRRSGNTPDDQIIPEFRLWPAIATAPLLPISLFWLGWTNYAAISIWSGLAACFCFGVVLSAMYVSSYEYIIDSYGAHAAIALSSIVTMRYIAAGGMVMAARPMYERMGVHMTMTWLGCVAMVLTPGPYLLWRYGKALRKRSPYAITDVETRMPED